MHSSTLSEFFAVRAYFLAQIWQGLALKNRTSPLLIDNSNGHTSLQTGMHGGLCHLKTESFPWVMKALVFMVWSKTFPKRTNISELYMAMSTANFSQSSWRRAEIPVNLLPDAEQSPSPQRREVCSLLTIGYLGNVPSLIAKLPKGQFKSHLEFPIYIAMAMAEVWMSPYKSGTKCRACSADLVSEFTSHEYIFMVKGGGSVKG